MSKIDVTYIDLLDITKMSNTQVTVSGGLMTLTPLPSDESEYERGMSKAMQKIAVSCGKKFAVDIGYKELPDLVESLVNPKQEKTKRVKVEYVKCEFDKVSDLVIACESGETFYCNSSIGGKGKLEMYGAISMHRHSDNLYRKVETEIDERQEFIDFTSEYIKNLNPEILKSFEYIARAMFDSGKFKLVNDK